MLRYNRITCTWKHFIMPMYQREATKCCTWCLKFQGTERGNAILKGRSKKGVWQEWYLQQLGGGLTTGPLFTKRTDVLPQDLVKSRSRVDTFWIALKFDRHIDRSAVEMPVKCQSDKISITPNLVASIFGGKTSYWLVNRGPGVVITHDCSGYLSVLYEKLWIPLPQQIIYLGENLVDLGMRCHPQWLWNGTSLTTGGLFYKSNTQCRIKSSIAQHILCRFQQHHHSTKMCKWWQCTWWYPHPKLIEHGEWCQ